MHTTQTARPSLRQRLDVWRFSSQLPDYYEDLAALLGSSRDIRQIDIFLQDAQRYEGTPRGRLSAQWAEAYSNNGADLASTWSGFMPDDDVAILRVQQDLGSSAIVAALADLGRMAKTSKALRDSALASVGVGMLAFVIASLAATARSTAAWASEAVRPSSAPRAA